MHLNRLASKSKCLFGRITLGNSPRNYADWPPPKLQRKYDLFQQENGLPVHLKGGTGDRVMLGFTCALIVVGLANGLYTIYHMAMPKKKA